MPMIAKMMKIYEIDNIQYVKFDFLGLCICFVCVVIAFLGSFSNNDRFIATRFKRTK